MSRIIRRVALGSVILIAIALIALAAFPWAILKDRLEAALSRRFDRPVTIGAMERIGSFSLRPIIRIHHVRVAEEGWAGRRDMAQLRTVEFRVPLWKLRPDQIRIEGLRLHLARAADGRENWRPRTTRPDEPAGPPDLTLLTVTDARVTYADAKRHRSLDAALSIDGKGLSLRGKGTVLGSPVSIRAQGGPVEKHGPWPFRLRIAGPMLNMAITGAMDRPLDTAHLDMAVTAHAANLSYVDAIIEAGLPRTQPVRLHAKARRDGVDWAVTGLTGMVGRSDISGEATIRKRAGRHIIDGSLRARRFDFDDLSDARGRAIAAAKRAQYGPRVFPDTAVDLDNVKRTDGTLRLHADQLLWPRASPFRSLDATIRVDHSRLTIDDLRIGLTHGTMRGSFSVDQRSGRPVMTMDLRLSDARVMDFAPDTQIDGRMAGRLRLSGPGRTIRAAIGRSDGSIAVVARDGTLPARTASLLGQDLLAGLFSAKGKLASLRCAVVRLEARQGLATADPILIDTTRARTDMTGQLSLADERLALRMRGAPKQHASLRLQGDVVIRGTLKAPEVDLPGKGGVVGAVLKSIGHAIGGADQPVAQDTDCDAMSLRAMR